MITAPSDAGVQLLEHPRGAGAGKCAGAVDDVGVQ
jgi:hypothetical protein